MDSFNLNQHLDSLVSDILSSVEVIKAEYAKYNATVPSLDSTEVHIFDKDESNTQLYNATRTIVFSCDKLKDTVRNPTRGMLDHFIGFYEHACLRVVSERNVAAHLREAGEAGLHASVLAEKIGVDANKLTRILRCLTIHNIFREVKENVFANNRLSITMDEGNTMSFAVRHFTNSHMKGAHALSDVLIDPVMGPSSDPSMAPLLRAYNVSLGRDTFSWWKEEHPEELMAFAHSMTDVTGIVCGPYVFTYPWSELPRDTQVVDVAGGIGHAMMDVYRAHPHLQFVIQDLPEPVEEAPKIWAKQCDMAVKEKRVRFKAFDMFKDSPIESADIYYLRYIIHDWPDEKALVILKNIRKAMKPGSKLLIHELNLLHANSDNIGREGLSPSAFPYIIDIVVMIGLNARERSVQEYVELGKRAGLQLEKVYPTGELNIMEFHIQV